MGGQRLDRLDGAAGLDQPRLVARLAVHEVAREAAAVRGQEGRHLGQAEERLVVAARPAYAERLGLVHLHDGVEVARVPGVVLHHAEPAVRERTEVLRPHAVDPTLRRDGLVTRLLVEREGPLHCPEHRYGPALLLHRAYAAHQARGAVTVVPMVCVGDGGADHGGGKGVVSGNNAPGCDRDVCDELAVDPDDALQVHRGRVVDHRVVGADVLVRARAENAVDERERVLEVRLGARPRTVHHRTASCHRRLRAPA